MLTPVPEHELSLLIPTYSQGELGSDLFLEVLSPTNDKRFISTQFFLDTLLQRGAGNL